MHLLQFIKLEICILCLCWISGPQDKSLIKHHWKKSKSMLNSFNLFHPVDLEEATAQYLTIAFENSYLNFTFWKFFVMMISPNTSTSYVIVPSGVFIQFLVFWWIWRYSFNQDVSLKFSKCKMLKHLGSMLLAQISDLFCFNYTGEGCFMSEADILL